MKILVVDDEKFNLTIANDFIKKSGIECEVILCNDPVEVQRMMAEKIIDVVFLDIIMPKMTGIDVLKQIRANTEYNNVQVLMLTSLTDSDSFKKCFEMEQMIM